MTDKEKLQKIHNSICNITDNDNNNSILKICQQYQIELVVVGPEKYIVNY